MEKINTMRIELLTPAAVADLYGVDVKTVGRWATQGRLQCIRTPGNHRRYPSDQPVIAEALAAIGGQQP